MPFYSYATAISTTLPQQFYSRLQRFFHVVHSGLNVGVGQLTKPRNYICFSSSIVTRINLCRDTSTHLLQHSVEFYAFLCDIYNHGIYYEIGGHVVTLFSLHCITRRILN